jgi:hypothetical protein
LVTVSYKNSFINFIQITKSADIYLERKKSILQAGLTINNLNTSKKHKIADLDLSQPVSISLFV